LNAEQREKRSSVEVVEDMTNRQWAEQVERFNTREWLFSFMLVSQAGIKRRNNEVGIDTCFLSLPTGAAQQYPLTLVDDRSESLIRCH
jgi:hypothetical protein